MSSAYEVEEAARAHRTLELLAVLLLGLATVGSAWCGYQASRWNGEETRQSRIAEDARIDSSRQSALATQKIAYDASIAAQYASAVALKQDKLRAFYRQVLVRPEFLPVIDRWEAQAAAGQTPSGNLFDDKAYVESQTAPVAAADARAATARDRAEAANARSDDYVLTTLLMASALFFAGVTSSFGSRSSRVLLLVAAGVVIAVAAARLADLPTI